MLPLLNYNLLQKTYFKVHGRSDGSIIDHPWIGFPCAMLVHASMFKNHFRKAALPHNNE